MQDIKRIFVDETDSTNRLLGEYKGEEGCFMTVLHTDFQTSGRGQGTNHWESERGKNLLVSMMTHPHNVPAARQFVLLEAAALAIKDTLEHYAEGFCIKWPNDIYYKDHKISGTLSECRIGAGGIKRCIIGTGININQQSFISDAPNPISLLHIVEQETNRNEVLEHLIMHTKQYMTRVHDGDFENIHNEYIQALYRRNGMHRYSDKSGEFMARIENIKPNGHLILYKEDGTLGEYAFKEVEFLI